MIRPARKTSLQDSPATASHLGNQASNCSIKTSLVLYLCAHTQANKQAVCAHTQASKQAGRQSVLTLKQAGSLCSHSNKQAVCAHTQASRQSVLTLKQAGSLCSHSSMNLSKLALLVVTGGHIALEACGD